GWGGGEPSAERRGPEDARRREVRTGLGDLVHVLLGSEPLGDVLRGVAGVEVDPPERDHVEVREPGVPLPYDRRLYQRGGLPQSLAEEHVRGSIHDVRPDPGAISQEPRTMRRSRRGRYTARPASPA